MTKGNIMALPYFEQQIAEIRAKAELLRDSYHRRVESINRDTALTEEGKRLAIEPIRESAKAELKTLLANEKQVVDDKIEELERSLDAKSGNAATDIIAFRDAQDRAERLDDPTDAERVLTRALRTNDTSLAHAIFRRALEARWPSVINQFKQANPELAHVAADLNELRAFQEQGMERALAYGLFA